jgi:hypothetical protein
MMVERDEPPPCKAHGYRLTFGCSTCADRAHNWRRCRADEGQCGTWMRKTTDPKNPSACPNKRMHGKAEQ